MAKRKKIEKKNDKGDVVITGVAIEISEEEFMEFLKSTYKQEELANKGEKSE